MSVALTHAPAKIVRQLLVDRGWAANPDTTPLGNFPAYFGNEPSVPDNCITVYDTSPKIDGRTMVGGIQVQHHGLQLRIRSVDEDNGFLKAADLRLKMSEQVWQSSVTIGTKQYIVWALVDLNLLRLGRDTGKTKLSLITINAYASITARN